ncbi:hypothetical protein ACHAXA_008475 [Cyclostephanos tholiformis]|uniref:Transcription initiation factor IIF subunit beta n=1 Tax=Cyclostephanos tholiformis TaxID=382380 RepID=A0ABD3SB18_9STRA
MATTTNNLSAAGGTRSKPPAAVSGSTYGAIQSSFSDMWMIRLPNRLATAWEDAPEGAVLGTLTFTKGGGGGGGDNSSIGGTGPPAAKRVRTTLSAVTVAPPPQSSSSSSKISITIDPSISDSQSDLPVTYTLEAMTKRTPGALHPFTRNSDGSVSIHGKISRTASAQVAHGVSSSGGVAGVGGGGTADDNRDDGSRYRTLCRNRLLEMTVNSKRFVQPGGDANQSGPLRAATAASSLGTGFGGSVARFGKQMLDARERARGLGMTGEASGPPIVGIDGVRTALFEYFSKKTLWSVKDLRYASGGRLPERETREVLRDIAEYHRTGEHKNMWELKSEFKSAISSTAPASNSSGGS